MKPPYCRICDHNHYGVEHVFRESDSGAGESKSEEGDVVFKPEGGNPGDSALLRREVAPEGVEPGNRVDARPAELRGTAVHKQVQKGGRAVSGEAGAVKVSFDRVAYQREYMRRWRPKRST